MRVCERVASVASVGRPSRGTSSAGLANARGRSHPAQTEPRPSVGTFGSVSWETAVASSVAASGRNLLPAAAYATRLRQPAAQLNATRCELRAARLGLGISWDLTRNQLVGPKLFLSQLDCMSSGSEPRPRLVLRTDHGRGYARYARHQTGDWKSDRRSQSGSQSLVWARRADRRSQLVLPDLRDWHDLRSELASASGTSFAGPVHGPLGQFACASQRMD